MERQRKRETPLMDESAPSKKIDVNYDNFLFSEDLHDVVFEFEDDAENVIDGASPVDASEVDDTCNCPKSDDNGQRSPPSQVHCARNNEKIDQDKKGANGGVQAGEADDTRNLQTYRNVQTIPAHSQILAFSSEVFRAQLFGTLQERTIKITDASFDSFRTFLRCIYTGELEITTENMFELAYLANKYMIPKITYLVAEFFKDELDKDESFWKLFNPQRIALFDDEEKSLLNMQLALFESATEKYLDSEEFLWLSEEIVGELVRCEPLSIKEADLYRAVVQWAEFQCKRDGLSLTESNMRTYVESFVHSLRMPTLRQEELIYNGGIHSNKLLLHEEKVNLAAYCSGLTSTDIPFARIPRRNSRDVIVCTTKLLRRHPIRNTEVTHVDPNVNFRFVGVTYLLDVQKEGEVPGKVITEVLSTSKPFPKKTTDYDVLCSFEWVASPEMEVSKYEVVSMAKNIVMFSSDRHYCITSRPSPGIWLHKFNSNFKDDSPNVYFKEVPFVSSIKSVHLLLP